MPDKIRISRLTFGELELKKIQIPSKFESMINFNPQFNLFEITERNNKFPQNCRSDHTNKRLHLLIIRMKRIWYNITNFIRWLMIKHEKISIDANKTLAILTLLDLLYNLKSMPLTNQTNIALIYILGQEIRPQPSNLNLLKLRLSNNNIGLKVLSNFKNNSMLTQSTHRY